MKFFTRIILLMAFILTSTVVSAQDSSRYDDLILPRWNIKTNLLYDATATFNLGVEFRIGEKMSFDLPVSYNPWTFANNKKWKHVLVQPELRWWPRTTFDGHFLGVHGHYATYNVGGLPNPPFSQYMNEHRFEGWLAGAGVSYGYRYNFDHRWAAEATVGIGYAYLSYDEFECAKCGELLSSELKSYFGPTKVGLNLIYGFGGQKGAKVAKVKPAPVPVAPRVVAAAPPPPPPPPPPQPRVVEDTKPITSFATAMAASFIIPEVEMPKIRNTEVNKAHLDFIIGRYEILSNFKGNFNELRRIHDLIQQVMQDPDATITGITLVGHASQDGTYADNMLLSENRAQALKNHLKVIYSFDEKMFNAWGAGEDWATLDSMVWHSFYQDKYRILEIIRGSQPHDARKRQLQTIAGGSFYRQISEELFPQIRRVDYQLHYTVVPFSVERGKEVFRTTPGHLSLNEMYMIAQSYEPGSAEYFEIFETAARLFPQNDVANLNAAASAINRRDTASATYYLDKVKVQNFSYWNNLGILAWLNGDKEKAVECFTKGGLQGSQNLKLLGL